MCLAWTREQPTSTQSTRRFKLGAALAASVEQSDLHDSDRDWLPQRPPRVRSKFPDVLPQEWHPILGLDRRTVRARIDADYLATLRDESGETVPE